ncbi:HNH endonuclease signature motif containing protein [Alkalihalobacillus sp. TS-13]|uniref:HNH endonuclease signature motif containing protein n=1 Tax=Alkalihalobacillus sp. TS-13 TaxID=2842455 RepID=UPI001C88C3E7|nr:HNH endonuclease signature motif containing protein [Alkalihalobacillus sp. TS-13]
MYKKLFSLGTKTIRIRDTYLFPIGNVTTVNALNFSPKLTLYTYEGRESLFKKLRPDIQKEVSLLMKATLPNRSVEYLDNRISRYSMKMGKCEITGQYLFAYNVHYIPKHLGGSDQFHNLRILHEDVHRLIHMKDDERINLFLNKLGLNQPMLNKINQYRKVCKLDSIEPSRLEG